jgi:glycosyltransferase involved in cell wall biosynthesis
MIQVDEIFPTNIKLTIGPAGTIKRLFAHRDYFTGRGYEMRVYVPLTVIDDKGKKRTQMGEMTELPSVTESVKQKRGWRDLLKARKHAFVESNRFTSSWVFHKHTAAQARLMDEYIAMGRTPEIIVFHGFFSCWYYMRHRKEHQAKVAMFIHGPGDDDNQFSQRRPKLVDTKDEQENRKKLLEAFEMADEVVWISQNGKRVFLSNHPQYAAKTSAVVNGITDMPHIEVAPSTPHRFRMVTTGTVCERKGQYIIIEAMHCMKPEVLKDTHLTVMGIGADYSRLVSLVAEYGLEEHVTFLGNVPNAEVHQHLCAENIFVLMSRNEGLPISVIEAMRAGLPVISTRVDGIPEQVDERNGILIDPNIAQLTEVLNQLPQYDWTKLGKASRKRFEEEYTFNRMLNDYADMFDKLLKNRK